MHQRPQYFIHPPKQKVILNMICTVDEYQKYQDLIQKIRAKGKALLVKQVNLCNRRHKSAVDKSHTNPSHATHRFLYPLKTSENFLVIYRSSNFFNSICSDKMRDMIKLCKNNMKVWLISPFVKGVLFLLRINFVLILKFSCFNFLETNGFVNEYNQQR